MLITDVIARDVRRHRESFCHAAPMERWLTLPDFLDGASAARIWRACRAAQYRTFCGYMVPGEQGYRNEFHEPNLVNTYISVHRRSLELAEPLRELERAMGSAETLDLLRAMTGEPLERLGQVSTLSCWEEDCFVTPHTDSGKLDGGAKLVLWIWFCSQWRPEYGGITGFQWPHMREPYALLPEFNRAVLFRPFDGSFHWVTPVGANAPRKARFTWTLHYL